MCSGNLWFKFYKDDEPIAILSFHHGRSLRLGGWPGDGVLAYGSAGYLCRWLADHGIKGPLHERREGIVREITSIPLSWIMLAIGFGLNSYLLAGLCFILIFNFLITKNGKGQGSRDEVFSLIIHIAQV